MINEYWNSPTFIANVEKSLENDKQQLDAYKKLLAKEIDWEKTDTMAIKTLIKGFQHYYPHERFAGVDVKEILLYLKLLKIRLSYLKSMKL